VTPGQQVSVRLDNYDAGYSFTGKTFAMVPDEINEPVQVVWPTANAGSYSYAIFSGDVVDGNGSPGSFSYANSSLENTGTMPITVVTSAFAYSMQPDEVLMIWSENPGVDIAGDTVTLYPGQFIDITVKKFGAPPPSWAGETMTGSTTEPPDEVTITFPPPI
jgi:hypothetical protein